MNFRNNIMDIKSKIFQNIDSFFKEKLALEKYEKFKTTLKKIDEFIKSNKSLIFFSSTVLFSVLYQIVPYFNFKGSFIDFKEGFIAGSLYATCMLIFKNLINPRPLTKNQDDRINYLAGLASIELIYLYPKLGFINVISRLQGFVAIKNVYKYIDQDYLDNRNHKREDSKQYLHEDTVCNV